MKPDIPVPEVTKVLGLWWDTGKDVLYVATESLKNFLASAHFTKRTALQAAARAYHPFGFISPFVISVRVLLQKAWKLNLAWDDNILPHHILNDFSKWHSEIPKLQCITFPRQLTANFQSEPTTVRLHVFCDASPLPYGAVAYLVTEGNKRTLPFRIIEGKSESTEAYHSAQTGAYERASRSCVIKGTSRNIHVYLYYCRPASVDRLHDCSPLGHWSTCSLERFRRQQWKFKRCHLHLTGAFVLVKKTQLIF